MFESAVFFKTGVDSSTILASLEDDEHEVVLREVGRSARSQDIAIQIRERCQRIGGALSGSVDGRDNRTPGFDASVHGTVMSQECVPRKCAISRPYKLQ